VLWRTHWGTYWEPDKKPLGRLKNIVGSHWERGKNGKKNLKILPPKNLKGKIARHLKCMLGPYHWLHEISHPKKVCHPKPLQTTPYTSTGRKQV
jgi:hypothetical protein